MENEKNFVIDEITVMAQMELQLSETKKTKRKLHPSLRIDMTPMVDLGFLLITFFILTTTMSEKKAMKLYMPTDKGTSSAPESKVLTVLLSSNNKVFAYEGKFEDALKENRVFATTTTLVMELEILFARSRTNYRQIRKKVGWV